MTQNSRDEATQVIDGDRLSGRRGGELSNGALTAQVSPWGLGDLVWNQYAITAPALGPLYPGQGHGIYCRDINRNQLWSAGRYEAGAEPDGYPCQVIGDPMWIDRSDHGIRLSCGFQIAPSIDALLCRCILTNDSNETRQLELISYLETVLQPAEVFLRHPAFSKLFLETAWQEDLQAIHVRRRPREANERSPELFHCLLSDRLGGPHGYDGPHGYETSRAAFIGRGHDLSRPKSLLQDPSPIGRVGTVLDPIASLRWQAVLEPGETGSVLFATIVAMTSAKLRELREQLRDALQDDREAWALLEDHDCRARTASGSNSSSNSGPAYRLEYRPASALADHVSSAGQPSLRREALQFDNGIGGFNTEGTEYVIRLTTDPLGHLQLPPTPWVNVIANPQAGCIISETGSVATWAKNSRQNRLTPWFNDPVLDPCGDAIYVRDEDQRLYWSALPAPVPHLGEYEVRHGFGYSKFDHTFSGLDHSVTVFVPVEESCKITFLRLTNRSDQPRRLSLFGFQQWVLGDATASAPLGVDVRWDSQRNTVLARRPGSPEANGSDAVAFSSAWLIDRAATTAHATDGRSFVGNPKPAGASLRIPDAVTGRASLADETELSSNNDADPIPAAAIQLSFTLPPGESVECVCMLGEAETPEAAAAMQSRFRTAAEIDAQLARVADQWNQLARVSPIKTPSPALNLMANGWLTYQNISCRMWGRSSLYQGGGAFGFRDQLQDAGALMYHHPHLTRQQILRHAAHQFIEGDVMHWWHPEDRLGIRTRFSDDLLWLPLVAAEYVQTTGDESLWDERVPFVTDRLLRPGEDEALLRPRVTEEQATVLEHCCLALDRSVTLGRHGLPLMGTGDWNDGMNRVGREGVGESVWMGFFLYRILQLMLPVLQRRGADARADRYRALQADLKESLNTHGWDGEWFLRAFHDGGQVIGSKQSAECRIDALCQAWSVLSQAGDEPKQQLAMAAVERELVDEQAGLIRLLTPPFNKVDFDPGYIKGYLPGLRENGGQYTHGVLWAIRALAERGQGERATRLLEMICPVTRTRTAKDVARYKTEPYVVAADVYAAPQHMGRGGWSWYTGSAGWMYRVIWETILGVTVRAGSDLRIDPRVPRDWDRFELEYRWPPDGSVYQITVTNPHRVEQGVASVTLDGRPLSVDNGVASIPLAHDAQPHHIDIEMG